MCGIAGFIDASVQAEAADELLLQMLETITHRGPDASGRFVQHPVCLGHNRLSIIDLSDEANQPFRYDHLVLTFNGEIYNYLEIKEELKGLGFTFRTQSDTEVILAAYKKWGASCVKRFMGMWSFAIWDEKEQELFCSRDRFGIKPFYYIHGDGAFYFASEYKPLKRSKAFSSELNLSQVARGVQLGLLGFQNETYFKCIQSLPGAHNLIWKNGEIKVERYWDVDFNRSHHGSEEDMIAEFRALFLQSVTQHMRSDVEVGACLSGGIDSSSIVSVLGKHFPETPLKTFTAFYPQAGDVDERPWANQVIQSFDNIQAHYYSPSDKELMDSLMQMMHFFDVPPSGSSPLSQYFVMKLARQEGIKVVQDGQGADEYLAGYMHSYLRLIATYFNRGRLSKGLSEWQNLNRLRGFGMKGALSNLGKSAYLSLFDEQDWISHEYRSQFDFLFDNRSVPMSLPAVSSSKLDSHLYHLMFLTSLPTLLHNEDRNSMAFSLESRVPFLDHRLVEFLFTIPPHMKMRNGVTKYILRESMKETIPKAIYERKDKKGFVTPGEVKWLRGPMAELTQFGAGDLPMLREDRLKSVLKDYRAGNNRNAKLVWRVAMLNQWLKSN